MYLKNRSKNMFKKGFVQSVTCAWGALRFDWCVES